MTLVMKFGGTSMGDAERIRQCAGLVREQESKHAVAAVVSAMSGVTDSLLELAAAAAAGNRAATHRILAELRTRHETAARTLGATTAIHTLLDRLDVLVSGLAAVGELTMRSRDAVVSFGERLSAELMAAALGCRAMTGHEIGIVTNDHFGEADPLMDLTLFQVRQTLEPLLASAKRVVVTGFIAGTQHGVISTLGRGGSDYTATIIGAALPAEEIWIWSDVDGLMTANPKVVPEAKLLAGITFAEAIEMGQFGAKSMHPRALEPAATARIPVRMRSTFNPKCAGTLISEGATSDRSVRSVLSVSNTALVTVSGAAMIGRPGTAARVFDALAKRDVNILMISQSVSEAGISLVVAGSQLERARAALDGQLVRTGDVRDLGVEAGMTVVAVVGSAMRGTPGVAARVFSAIAKHGVNVSAIAQGSSELSISFVVHGEQGAAAVRALHGEFGLDRA